MPSRLQKLCRKTLLCRFQGAGRCRKGAACPFAHCREEVQAAPDFSRTKVCPAVAVGKTCEDAGCSFAHHAGELRRVWERSVRRETPANKIAEPESPQRGMASSNEGTQGKRMGHRVPLLLLLQSPHLPQTQADEIGFSRQTTSDTGPLMGCATRQSSASFGSLSQLSEQSMSETGRLSGFEAESAVKGNSSPASQESAELEPVKRRIFHKTKLCAFNLRGMCAKGRDCGFAHGAEELGPMPNLHRTKLCRALVRRGKCTEANCRFAHGDAELRSVSWGDGPGLAGGDACGASNSMPTLSKDPHHPIWGRQAAEDPGSAAISVRHVLADAGRAERGRHEAEDSLLCALEDGGSSNWARHASEGGGSRNFRAKLGRADLGRLSVKNTFFHMESEDEEVMRLKQRSHSAPAHASVLPEAKKTCLPIDPPAAPRALRSSAPTSEGLGTEERRSTPLPALSTIDPGPPAPPMSRRRRHGLGRAVPDVLLPPVRLG